METKISFSLTPSEEGDSKHYEWDCDICGEKHLEFNIEQFERRFGPVKLVQYVGNQTLEEYQNAKRQKKLDSRRDQKTWLLKKGFKGKGW